MEPIVESATTSVIESVLSTSESEYEYDSESETVSIDNSVMDDAGSDYQDLDMVVESESEYQCQSVSPPSQLRSKRQERSN